MEEWKSKLEVIVCKVCLLMFVFLMVFFFYRNWSIDFGFLVGFVIFF